MNCQAVVKSGGTNHRAMADFMCAIPGYAAGRFLQGCFAGQAYPSHGSWPLLGPIGLKMDLQRLEPN
jgi:hypothetical protein